MFDSGSLDDVDAQVRVLMTDTPAENGQTP
jgi:hypothetical protein